jgi:hypothetical protein
MNNPLASNLEVIPISVYLELEKEREEKEEIPEQNELNFERNIFTESVHIHNKAIFDAFNEALIDQRLYKRKGEPLPWEGEYAYQLSPGKR